MRDRKPSPRLKGPSRPAPRPAAAGLWLHGRHAVEAALANPRRSCHRLLATRDALARFERPPERPGLEIATVPRERIERELGSEAVHQGLALLVAPLAPVDLATIADPAGPRLLVALDQVSDPRNVGAILRSAAAFGAAAVIVPQHGSPPETGVLAKAAAGALELVPLARVTNLARALEELKGLGYWSVGLAARAERSLDDLPALERLVLVLGAEGKGMRRLVGERCDLLVRIPLAAGVESLNVAVAAGIALHALARRPGLAIAPAGA